MENPLIEFRDVTKRFGARSVLEQQVARAPAAGGHRAARFLEGEQKFVPQKRLAAPGEAVPGIPVGLRDTVEKTRPVPCALHAWAAWRLPCSSASVACKIATVPSFRHCSIAALT